MDINKSNSISDLPKKSKKLKIIKKEANISYSSDELDIISMFVDETEKLEAFRLLNKYLNTYSIETISEMNTLKQLIFIEVFNIRLQTELNNYHKDGQPSPPKTVDSLHSNLAQISLLKDKLGLGKSKNEESLNSGYNILGTLFKKWKVWRLENSGSRTCNCPHCGKMILFKIRMDAWETQKHPYFKDRILTNPYLMELYKIGRLTKHDVARVLGCSIDYIDWLVKKIYFKEFGTVSTNNPGEPDKDDSNFTNMSFIKSETLNEPIEINSNNKEIS